MTEYSFFSTLGALLLFLVHVAVIARVILRPHREPASRIAWIVMIIALPVVGMVSYLLLGETNIGRRRVRRMREMLAGMPSVADAPGTDAPALQAEIPERYCHLFRVGRSVNGFEPVGGNRGRLLPDSNASIESLVSDIDAAKDHVHLIFYIWLPDNNGLKVVGALKRAAARKVTCRVMADGLGSRIMIDSRALERDARCSRACGHRPADRQSATAAVARSHRPSQPSEDCSYRRLDHLLREPELRRSGVSYQGKVCALGRCVDAFRRPDRPAEPVSICQRLDGARGRRHSRTPAAPAASRRTGLCRAGDRHGTDGAQFRHARGVRDADVCGPSSALHHHALLRAGRSDADRALRKRVSWCRDDHHLSGAQRLLHRAGGHSQLLR